MIAELTNHLWQSTIFAVAVASLVWALRGNRAEIRHVLWMTASAKFLIPFSMLIALGVAAAPAPAAVPERSLTISVAVNQLAQPFNDVFTSQSEPPVTAIPVPMIPWPPVALAVWAIGFLSVVLLRVRGWRRIRASIRSSRPSPIRLPGSAVEIRSTDDLLGPGVVGWRHPVLLLPAGIEGQLSPAQLMAVIEHELCHVRRHDNLMATIHMVVEAVFWFHPLVWWIGARLMDERERACDEHVIGMIAEPHEYAEGILAVCKRYRESSVPCVSGVTGSELKHRIANIVNCRIGLQLTMARRGALVMAAVAAILTPFLAGVATAPLRAQQTPATAGANFDVVSIKPCASIAARPPAPPQAGGGRSGGAPWDAQASPGYVYWSCATLAQLVDQAYADVDHPLLNTPADRRGPAAQARYPRRVRGGPSWVPTELFTIETKAPIQLTEGALSGSASRALPTLTAPMSQALRSMLEDRFQLKVHRAQEQQDMYALRVAPGGLNQKTITKPKPGDCLTPAQYSAMEPDQRPREPALCGRAYVTMDRGQIFTSFTMRQLALFLSTSSIERYVLDETGLGDEPFNFVLKLDRVAGDLANADTLFARALEQLGLRLAGTKGPAEYLQIDRAERPRPDNPGDFRFRLR